MVRLLIIFPCVQHSHNNPGSINLYSKRVQQQLIIDLNVIATRAN